MNVNLPLKVFLLKHSYAQGNYSETIDEAKNLYDNYPIHNDHDVLDILTAWGGAVRAKKI